MNEEHLQDMWNVMRQHKLEIADDSSSEYECILCKKILINACTAHCRCLFCLDCIREYLKDGKRNCPGQSKYCDIESIDFNKDIKINRVINKTISRLSVKCPNFGCPSKVELNAIGDHLKTCENQPESCPYSMLGCEDDKLMKNQIRDHLSTEIHPHTKMLINWIRNSQNETRSMRNDIDKLREENVALKEQMRTDRQNNEEVIRELKKKEKENSEEIKILKNEMRSLKYSNRSINEELKLFTDKQEHEISQLNIEVDNQKDKIQELEMKYKLSETSSECNGHQSRKIHDSGIKVDKISKICGVLKTETSVTSQSVETNQGFIDELISRKFHWRIDKCAERLKNLRIGKEREIFSDSFLSHKDGFKICLSLKPDFDEGNLWIHLHIEKGHFDDILRWPFDRDLELVLINPVNGLHHKTWSKRCSLSDWNWKSKCLERPKTERNNPFFLSYIPLKELLNKAELTMNDEMWIKMSFTPASIEIKTK